MSSSFRSIRALSVALALTAIAPGVWAQQRYFVPRFEAMMEHNTNRELRTDQSAEAPESSNIYKAILEASLGQRTQRSDIELRPRLVYQEFPNCKCVDPLEEFLDLRSTFHTEKGGLWGINGRFSQQDTLNAELGQAEFDDDSDPSTPPELIDTGLVFVGQRRTRYEVEPSFKYPITQRYSIAGEARYQVVDYENIPDSARVGFKSPYFELTLGRALDQLTQIDFGPYYSRFEADNNVRTTDSYGLRVGLSRKWSERSSVSVVLRGERNETTALNTVGTESSTNFGLEILGERENRVGSLQYSIGRFLQPSALGNRRQQDVIQLEYIRPFSERVKLDTALRLTRDESVDHKDQGSNSQRDRARLQIELSRLMTQTLEVGLGYRFAWQDLGGNVDSAHNNAVYLSFSFKGLDPRRSVR